eukprot:482909_1
MDVPEHERQISTDTTNSDATLMTMASDVSKFDITVFPNASALNLVSKKTKLTKMDAPNPPLRPLQQIPTQIPDDDEQYPDAQPIIVGPHEYMHPPLKHRLLRLLATALAIVTALLLVGVRAILCSYCVKPTHICHIRSTVDWNVCQRNCIWRMEFRHWIGSNSCGTEMQLDSFALQ